MKDENERIYHQPIPDISAEKYESKIMIQPQTPPDLILNINTADGSKIPNALDALVPSEVQEMIHRFKDKTMEEVITPSLNNLENDVTIKEFINSLRLPPKIVGQEETNQSDSPIDIENFLWDKISYVQKLGGTDCLFKIIQNIENMSREMEEQLNKCLGALINEER